MKRITSLLTFIAIFAFAGCDNNKPLSMLLQESTKTSSELVDAGVDCYKGIASDTVNNEYALVFDKDCIDAVLLGDNYTADEIADMVSRDDFRLEGKTIKLTGEVRRRFEDTGNLILRTHSEVVSIWISPPYILNEGYDAEKTSGYLVENTYTFDVTVDYIEREPSIVFFDRRPEYNVWCDLIVESDE